MRPARYPYMASDDDIRTQMDALLRDAREQQAHALSTLGDSVGQLIASVSADLRREIEADLHAQTQTRIDAVQSAATSRLAQAEAAASARITALREEHTGETKKMRDEADARIAALDAQVKQVERERDERVADLEKSGAARIADLQARITEVERDRDQRAAEAAAAKASVPPPPTNTVASEREADPERVEDLLAGLRAIDGSPTLTDTLGHLVTHASRQAARAAVLLIRGQRYHAWRAAGFDGITPSSIDLDAQQAGVIARAAATARPVATSEADGSGKGSSAPSFAALPADRVGLAVPLSVGGHVVAVLYADDVSANAPRLPSVWPEAVEILVRHAARCLEAMTALKAAKLSNAAAGATNAASIESPDEAARRYAKLLVAEIKLYHQPAVDAGRTARDLAARLAPQIARARTLYEERIGPDVRSRIDYFNQELVRTLADGNPGLLGATGSGSAS
jgi:hypothetical protein